VCDIAVDVWLLPAVRCCVPLFFGTCGRVPVVYFSRTDLTTSRILDRELPAYLLLLLENLSSEPHHPSQEILPLVCVCMYLSLCHLLLHCAS
jgi:hypothetical protein